MLGKFSKGMVVKIPATFRSSNQEPVDMENVNVGIQFFDQAHRKMLYILQETKMRMVDRGMYVYEFQVPPHAEPGNYIVSIKAKHPGSISNIVEASDTFEVLENQTIVASTKPEEGLMSIDATFDHNDNPVAPAEPKPQPEFDINTFKIDQVKKRLSKDKLDVEDMVVDVYNLPIKGVHVNVFEKQGFMPKSPNNVKVGSTVSDENGVWKMQLSPGEYVFTYKGIGVRELREFRKV